MNREPPAHKQTDLAKRPAQRLNDVLLKDYIQKIVERDKEPPKDDGPVGNTPSK